METQKQEYQTPKMAPATQTMSITTFPSLAALRGGIDLTTIKPYKGELRLFKRMANGTAKNIGKARRVAEGFRVSLF